MVLPLNNLERFICHKTKKPNTTLKRELIFFKNLLRTFFPHLGNFFCVVSYFTTFRPNFTSGLLQVIFTASSDRNDESCNRIPSNYCLPELLSIAPRFLPSKPLAGLGRIWNRYLMTMLTWNRRDSTPLSAAPRAPN